MNGRLAFVELAVAGWEAAVRWYVEVLGLEVVMRADADRFALLAAGAGRLALKQGPAPASGVLLAFEVEGLDAWVARLRARGVALDGDIKVSAEGYRRAKLSGPEGVTVTLFEWRSPG